MDKKRFLRQLSSAENHRPNRNNRVLEIFSNVDLRKGHHGLQEIAKKSGHDVDKLQIGQYIVFINRAKTALKVFAPGNIVAYQKMPNNTQVDLRTLKHIPTFFNSGVFNYRGAQWEVMKKQFPNPTVQQVH